jgi:hypothetical protein
MHLPVIFPEFFYLIHQMQHQCMHALFAALDDDIRDLTVKRVALIV